MLLLINSFVYLLLFSKGLSVQSPGYFLKYLSTSEQSCKCIDNIEEGLQNAIKKSADYVERERAANMLPAIIAGVSIDGENVWIQAFGKTDIENNVEAHKDSQFRLASISKALTSALVGKLMERGLIDLEKSIYEYLKPSVFPVKQWNNTNVTLTVGQVMSHTAGLHATKYPQDFYNYYGSKNVTQSLFQFKDEPLLSAPGSQFNYSNFGFQVIGAVIESVLNETYESAINKMFKELDMKSTFCERHEEIIANKSRYYMRSDSYFLPKNSDKLKIFSAMVADDMWAVNKWLPSAGIVSKASDLLRFGNFMIESFKGVNNSGNLKPATVKMLWKPVILECEDCFNGTGYYAHGWGVLNLKKPIECDGKCRMPPITRFYYHTGGLSGLTTILAIFPEQNIVVTFLANMSPIEPILDMTLSIVNNFFQ